MTIHVCTFQSFLKVLSITYQKLYYLVVASLEI